MKLKALTLGLLLSFTAMSASAQTWNFDTSHTRIGFSIDHMGYSTTHGIFKKYDGTIIYDANNPDSTTIEVSINTNSVTTVSEDLDNHLKTDDFFDIEKYPTMTFNSTNFTLKEENKAQVIGDLTILGVTKPVTLDVTLIKHEESPMTKLNTIGFHATTIIKRSEWGMDTLIPAVGDEVEIRIDSELNEIKK